MLLTKNIFTKKKLLLLLGILLIIFYSILASSIPPQGLVVLAAPVVILCFFKPKYYIYFSLFFSSLFIGFGMKRIGGVSFGELDNIFKVAVLFGCGIVIFFYTTMSYKAENSPNQVKLRKIQPFYLSFAMLSTIYFIIPTITSVTVSDSFYGLKIFTPVLMFVLTIQHYDKINWKIAGRILGFLLFAHLAVSINQLFLLPGEYDIPRASGLTPSRNTLSMYTVTLLDLIFIIAALRTRKGALIKSDYIFLIVIMILQLGAFSRGTWAVFGVSVVLLLVWQRKYRLLTLILGIAAIMIYYSWNEIMLRFQFGVGTTENRRSVKEYLLFKANESPWFGHGFGSAQQFLIEGRTGLVQPHNDYVRLIVDTGYVGIVLVIIPFLMILSRMTSIMSKTTDKKVRLVAFITALSVMQIIVFMNVYNTIDMFFATTSFVWFFAAIAEIGYRRNGYEIAG